MTETATPMTLEELEATINKIESEERPSPILVAPPPVTEAPKARSPLALNDYVDADQLKRDVNFDVADLDSAICQHAGLFVHYSDLARRARQQWEKMKVTVEVLESRLYAIHKESMLAAGIKPTEAAVSAAVNSDPRWYAGKMKLIDAQAISNFANDAREAFSQRKDMLVQVSVDRRVEHQGELRIRAAQTANGELRTDVVNQLAQQRREATSS